MILRKEFSFLYPQIHNERNLLMSDLPQGQSRWKTFWEKYSHVLLILYVPFYLTWFFLIEQQIPPDYWVVYSRLDAYIPFCEWFAIPYVLWYFFMIAVGLYLLFTNVPDFRRYMWFIIISFTATLLFCTLVPNGQNLRPEVFPRDNILTRLMGLLYSLDTNTNVFPSMHVLGTFAATFAVFKNKKLASHTWVKIATAILCVLITLSTVFVKQHSALDLYCSVILSFLLYYILYYRNIRLPFSPKGENNDQKTVADSQS